MIQRCLLKICFKKCVPSKDRPEKKIISSGGHNILHRPITIKYINGHQEKYKLIFDFNGFFIFIEIVLFCYFIEYNSLYSLQLFLHDSLTPFGDPQR